MGCLCKNISTVQSMDQGLNFTHAANDRPLSSAVERARRVCAEFQRNAVQPIFFDTLWRFAYKIAELRKHEMIEARRDIKKKSD